MRGNQRSGDALQRLCLCLSAAPPTFLTSLEERLSHSSNGFIDRGLLNAITRLPSVGRPGGGGKAHQLKIRAEAAEKREAAAQHSGPINR